jgi:hypothetical protein
MWKFNQTLLSLGLSNRFISLPRLRRTADRFTFSPPTTTTPSPLTQTNNTHTQEEKEKKLDASRHEEKTGEKEKIIRRQSSV